MPIRPVWLRVVFIVLVLVASGIVFMVLSPASTAFREIGIALTTGGVTGFVFLVVQSVVAEAGERDRLLLHLSTTQDLTGVNLHGRSLDGLNLVGKTMPVAELSDAVLRNARFVGADLRWATLRRSDLRGSTFAYANLNDTNLRGARLEGADLRGATFRNAGLDGAVLDAADLAGADLRQAELEGCIFRRVYYDSATRWPPGYTLPPCDESVTDIHRNKPDWHDYWVKIGKKSGGSTQSGADPAR
jgi:hypothetical protein